MAGPRPGHADPGSNPHVCSPSCFQVAPRNLFAARCPKVRRPVGNTGAAAGAARPPHPLAACSACLVPQDRGASARPASPARRRGPPPRHVITALQRTAAHWNRAVSAVRIFLGRQARAPGLLAVTRDGAPPSAGPGCCPKTARDSGGPGPEHPGGPIIEWPGLAGCWRRPLCALHPPVRGGGPAGRCPSGLVPAHPRPFRRAREKLISKRPRRAPSERRFAGAAALVRARTKGCRENVNRQGAELG
jgi:hypothetical protein